MKTTAILAGKRKNIGESKPAHRFTHQMLYQPLYASFETAFVQDEYNSAARIVPLASLHHQPLLLHRQRNLPEPDAIRFLR